jgi:RNA polymerase sigma factor (sigma-70 family)
LDQSELVKRCQTGDKNAFEELYHSTCHQALKTAYLISGRRGVAEDIVQEAFIQCYKEIKRLKEPNAFYAWFYKILIRCSWRMLSKNKALASCCSVSANTVMDLNFCLDDMIETQEIYDQVRLAMEQLTIPLRTVVTLYYYNNLSIAEIAKVLDCVQGTVKSRLHNARKSIEKELMLYFNNDERKCTVKSTGTPLRSR